METTTLVAPLAPAAPRRARRHLALRAAGLLGILALVALTTLMVGSALLFHDAVQSHLGQLEEADARNARLLRQRAGAGVDIPELDRLIAQGAAERERHLAATHHYIEGSTVALASIGWLGITSIGSIALLFFSRLASDIAAVRGRALAILLGDRGGAPPLARRDELGELSRALEDLAETLGRSERELALERRNAIHREKLATIGSMAAGVIREIGNPIAAIDGYARALLDARAPGAGDAGELRAILRETARLVAISREISTLAAAPAAQWQLASVNEIVGQTLALLRYDRRLAGLRIATELDAQLPAVMAFPDRLLQLLTGLIGNAADATAHLPRQDAKILVATRCAADGVVLTVEDNGDGREPETVAGREAQGVPLGRAVVEAHGGRLSVAHAPDGGTRVTVWLPLPAPGR